LRFLDPAAPPRKRFAFPRSRSTTSKTLRVSSLQGIRPVGKKRRGNSSASSRLPFLFFPVLLIGNSISYFMSEIFKIILSFFHNRNEGKMFVHPVTHDAHGLALKKECALAHSRAEARLL